MDGGKDAQASLERMTVFFDAMLKETGTTNLAGQSFDLDFPDGLPVVTKSFDTDGNLEEEVRLKSVRRQRIDAETFEPPLGYKRRSM